MTYVFKSVTASYWKQSKLLQKLRGKKNEFNLQIYQESIPAFFRALVVLSEKWLAF